MKGAQVKAARELLGWTQADLAERARINRRTVANIESGTPAPRLLSTAADRNGGGAMLVAGTISLEDAQHKWR
jgi:hypothetical protein